MRQKISRMKQKNYYEHEKKAYETETTLKDWLYFGSQMRLRIIILLLFSFGAASGQIHQPVGVANTYALKAADGFPGSNYVSSFEYTPSGKVYAKDFFGNLHITGNNFVKHVPGLKNISNNTNLLVRSDSEAWLIDENLNITVIKNDSLWQTIAPPVRNAIEFIYYSQNKRFFCMKIRGEKLVLYELKNYVWKKLYGIPAHFNFRYKQLYGKVMKDGEMVLIASLSNGNQRIYGIDTTHLKLIFITVLPKPANSLFNMLVFYNKYWEMDSVLIKSLAEFIAVEKPSKVPITLADIEEYLINLFPDPGFIFNYRNDLYEYFTVDSIHINPEIILFETRNKLNGVRLNSAYPYLTVLTENEPFRVFPYIKKYPRIYNDGNSNNIFTLAQDDKGRIWAGSYQKQLSIIDDPLSPDHAPKIIRLKEQSYPFMNASLNYNGKIYLVGETMNGGILRYDLDGRMTKLAPRLPTGFYLYLAPKGQTVYYPSSSPYPVYYCNIKELEKPFVHWKKLDTTSGILPFGMASMTEDTLGRIWMGHPNKGFAVYNPRTKKGITYRTRKKETPIGFISSLTDKRGTVWMGSDNHGLWYYDDYHKLPTPENIHQVSHPLLNKVRRITSMAIYKDWLVMGCYNRVCLLNLDSFYHKKKIILRYLNPQEAAFTSYTEQNTMLASRTDGSIWFSTSDMLYRWDINTWLHLPTYQVKVNTFLQHGSNRIKMYTRKQLKLPSSIHGFDIFFEYLSPDALPRYTRTALVRRGDSIIFGKPGMKSRFSFKNLGSGSYTFYLEIFEQDGSTSRYQYAFVINKYLWQHWWFWVAVVLFFLLPFVLWLNARRRQAMQEKEISQMNLITLSNQFRPHFILNALNAIGADLKNNPGAESIISRLGESINLIFSHVQHKRVSHSLNDEWLLIKNVIQILRIMYLPELQVSIRGEGLLNKLKNMELPLGILEIHVENALLHGLRNKKSPPYNLFLEIKEDDENLYFTIKDNGIGREAAMAISSYKRNGVGTKNLNNIIRILNRYNKNKIDISYADLLENGKTGTMVIIKIPKEYYFKY